MTTKETASEMTPYGSVNTESTALPSSKSEDTDALLNNYQRGNTLSTSSSSVSEPLTLRRIAISISLYINLIITAAKFYAYIRTLSLSVLAALVDSVLDVVSQFVLDFTERHSTKIDRSSALYPAGAARLEPIGVLTCAALMGMASFEVVKQSMQELIFNGRSLAHEADDMSSFWSMLTIVVVKFLLLLLCQYACRDKQMNGKWLTDPTLEALSQDHLNDALSNAIAAVALLFALSTPSLWYLDPAGAILISVYIIYSWYTTAKEQIEQLTGKAAPNDFLDELTDIASNFDSRMVVDVCRAYHFGPKFLVELEVVLPKDTLLFESHDLGMQLQYEIEGREEVERCFVHIDYECREYDEHVVSKVPELRERIVKKMGSNTSCYSV